MIIFSVMHAIRSNDVGLSSSDTIVADVFQMGFFCIRVGSCFVKREDNCVDHSLAKYAINVVDFVGRLDDPLEWLVNFLCADIL